jgi:hypothetical protein
MVAWPPAAAVLALSALAHAALFLALNRGGLSRRLPGAATYAALDAAGRVEWDSHLVSNAQALLAAVGGYLCYFADDEGAFSTGFLAAFGESQRRNGFLMITAGYLLYDLALVVAHWSRLGSPLVALHHALILVAFTLGAASNIGTYYMAGFLVNEVSTPLLNQNYFLAASPSYRDGALYKLNGVLLFVSFFLSRIAFNAFNMWHMIFFTWQTVAPVEWPRMTALQQFLAALLTLLAAGHVIINFIWFAQLARAVARKLGRSRRDKTQPLQPPAAPPHAADANGTMRRRAGAPRAD